MIRSIVLQLGLLATASASYLGAYPNFVAPAVPAVAATCDVTKPPYSAKGDGTTLDTRALQQAIDGCAKAQRVDVGGGGQCFGVLLPAGKKFLTGALNLTSGLVLQIEGTLLGSTDPAHYPVVQALRGYGTTRDNDGLHCARVGREVLLMTLVLTLILGLTMMLVLLLALLLVLMLLLLVLLVLTLLVLTMLVLSSPVRRHARPLPAPGAALRMEYELRGRGGRRPRRDRRAGIHLRIPAVDPLP